MKVILNGDPAKTLAVLDLTETIRNDETNGVTKELTIRFAEPISKLEAMFVNATVTEIALFDDKDVKTFTSTAYTQFVSINNTFTKTGDSVYIILKKTV